MPRFRRRSPGWDETTTDEEFVERTRQGQREAFGVLCDRHHLRVYGYCYRCLGDREAAEDATGETFRKALSALPSYRSRSFRSWLFVIAHNQIADELRTRRPVMSLDAAGDLRDTTPSPEEVAVMTEDAETVVAMLSRLTPDQRDTVAMRLAGLSPVEIGEALGKSRAAVDMVFYRAMVRLRQLMTLASPPASGGGRRE